MIDYENARITLFERLGRSDDKQYLKRRERAKWAENHAKSERLRRSILKIIIREGKRHEKSK